MDKGKSVNKEEQRNPLEQQVGTFMNVTLSSVYNQMENTWTCNGRSIIRATRDLSFTCWGENSVEVKVTDDILDNAVATVMATLANAVMSKEFQDKLTSNLLQVESEHVGIKE